MVSRRRKAVWRNVLPDARRSASLIRSLSTISDADLKYLAKVGENVPTSTSAATHLPKILRDLYYVTMLSCMRSEYGTAVRDRAVGLMQGSPELSRPEVRLVLLSSVHVGLTLS